MLLADARDRWLGAQHEPVGRMLLLSHKFFRDVTREVGEAVIIQCQAVSTLDGNIEVFTTLTTKHLRWWTRVGGVVPTAGRCSAQVDSRPEELSPST